MNRPSVSTTLLSSCALILAAALVYHAIALRFQVTHLNAMAIMRTDRMTGHVDVCWTRRNQGIVCEPERTGPKSTSDTAHAVP